MLIESQTGLVTARRRTFALRFGDAMDDPLLRGLAFRLATSFTLSRNPQIDDFSHPQSSSPNSTC